MESENIIPLKPDKPKYKIKKVDTNLERQILIGFIISDDFLKEMKLIYKPQYLTTFFARIVSKWCFNYFDFYVVAPKIHIQDLYTQNIKEGNLQKEDIVLIGDFLESITEQYTQEGFNYKYILDESVKYFNNRKLEILKDKLREVDDPQVIEKYLIEYQQSIKPKENKLTLEDVLFSETDKLWLSFQEVNELLIEEPKFLIHPWLREGEICMVTGAPGIGKTFYVMESARCASQGTWGMHNQWDCTDTINCLFVDGELSLYDLKKRTEVLDLGSPNLTLLSKTMLERNDVPFNLKNEDARELLSNFILKGNESGRFQLVILDNIFSLFPGVDLLSGLDWSEINSWLIGLRSKGITILLVHHTTKAGDQYGSITKEFNIDCSLLLKDARDNEKEDCCFSVKVTKKRSQFLNLEGKKYRLTDGEWFVEEIKQSNEELKKVKVIQGLFEGMKQKELAQMLKVSKGRITQIKDEMLKKGYIQIEGKEFIITTKGELFIKDNDYKREVDFD
jgi:RecA-family ATPase